MSIIDTLAQQLNGTQLKIVFPESQDDRILEATLRLVKERLVHPVLIGDVSQVTAYFNGNGIIEGFTVIDPATSDLREQLKEALLERRQGKVTAEQAEELVEQPNYFGVLLVYAGYADGMVSGAVYTTADTVRPALQLIKTKPGITRTSGAFLMEKAEHRMIFSDCAVNIDPDSEALAGIATGAADLAKMFHIDPKVALLSYSSKGSGSGPAVDKVAKAASLAQEARPDLLLDGELQVDAAVNQVVAMKKVPQSPLKGQANVLIFPNIEAGNIGYKLVQRLGGYDAIGPILVGLNKPVSDLSRGCNADDVYKLTVITASQALADKA